MTSEDLASPLPAGARLLDGLTFVAAAAGLLLEFTGGPRFEVFGVPVSLRGGTRLLLAAGALAGIRHLLVPRCPLHRRLAAFLALVPRGPFLRIVLPGFAVSRLAVLLVGCVAALLIPPPASLDRLPSAGNDALSSLVLRWDAAWYEDIAVNGYRAQPAANGEQNVVYFPAYPLLVRFTSYLVGGRPMIAGLLVSLGAFLAALAYFHAFARERLGDERAGAAVVLLASYPFAVFYGAVYTESLFLLAAVGALFHLSRREHARCALWALLAGLTRPNGCLLSVVLAAFALQDLLARRTGDRWRWVWLGSGGEAWSRNHSNGGLPRGQGAAPAGSAWGALVAALMPVAGLGLYSGYLFHLTGNPLSWMLGEAAWHRHFAPVAGVASGPFRQMLEYGVLGALRTMPLEALNSFAAAFAIAAIWPVWRRFGLAMALFVVMNLAAPLVAGGVGSVGRYTSVLFPIFLWLGAAVPAERRPLWAFAFAAGQALIAVLFFTWRPIG